LGKFLQDNLECAEEVLCQYRGFSGIQGDLEHLREEYREWAQRVKEREERQAAEKTLAEIRALAEKQRAVSEKRRAAGLYWFSVNWKKLGWQLMSGCCFGYV
jgi:hypothetical protein